MRRRPRTRQSPTNPATTGRRDAGGLRLLRRAAEAVRPDVRPGSRRLSLLWGLLAPLAFTLAVELPVAAALGLRSGRALAAVACVSLVTNPLLTLAGLLLSRAYDWSASPAGALAVVLPAEVAVVLVEWRLLLWALGGSPRRMFLVSAAMNAASALAGLAFWVA